MLPLSAAIGLHQLEQLDEIERRRRANYDALALAVESTEMFLVPTPTYRHEHGLYVFSFLLREGFAGRRDAAVDHMQRLGGAEFDAPGSTKPLHREPLFCQGRPGRSLAPTTASFPGADAFCRRLIKCPLWGYAGDEEFVEGYAKIIAIAGQQ
jgi:dTDP-4-amino-4,6-dideoxygalactose transaminase